MKNTKYNFAGKSIDEIIEHLAKEKGYPAQKLNHDDYLAVIKQAHKIKYGSNDEPARHAKGGKVGDEFELISWDCMVNKDSYEEGEGENVNNFGQQENKTFSSLQELVKYIGDHITYKDYNKADFSVPSADDGRIDCQVLVDVNNYPASESEKEKWKKGDLDLYAAYYVFHIGKVKREPITSEEIVKELGVEKYAKGGKIENPLFETGDYTGTYEKGNFLIKNNKEKKQLSFNLSPSEVEHVAFEVSDYIKSEMDEESPTTKRVENWIYDNFFDDDSEEIIEVKEFAKGGLLSSTGDNEYFPLF